eukprot:scaffold114427_cov66-Phaeocystis_antarctica.AAC.2
MERSCGPTAARPPYTTFRPPTMLYVTTDEDIPRECVDRASVPGHAPSDLRRLITHLYEAKKGICGYAPPTYFRV